MKRHDRLSVLKEPVPFFLLLLTLFFLVVILYLSYSLYYRDAPDSATDAPTTKLPEEVFPFPEELPV